ncbi:hypothetical protein Aperf_G00000067162 [Anoplocephala perfoliata]
MAAASQSHLNLEIASDGHKRGSLRKGSIFNLFNIASSERLNETTVVDIQLFDGTKMCALIDHRVTGEILLNHIAAELGDAAKAKYLGLIIEPPGELPEWMDLYDSVAKEKSVKGFSVVMVRIKFYPADPVLEMKPEAFANLLYFQLRHDLAVGRLLGKERDRCLMVAYSIKYEGGLKNVSKSELQEYNVVRSKISPHTLDNSMQNQIKEYLEENYEISTEEALNSFLKVATRMDTYGIEPFDARDQRGNGIAVGFNFRGLSVFKSSQQVNFFRWESMSNYECERKNVTIIIKTHDIKKKIGFKCPSRAYAMQLFRRLREASRFFYEGDWENKMDSEKPRKLSSLTIKSTESLSYDSSTSSSSQICQVKRLYSLAYPQRYFALSHPRVQSDSPALNPPPIDDAVTPTNQPTPSQIPAIHLSPPEPDEGPKTPSLRDSITDVTEPTVSGLSILPQNNNQLSINFNEHIDATRKQESGVLENEEKEKGDQKTKKKLDSDAENFKNKSKEREVERENPVVTIKVDLVKDESDSSKGEEEGTESPSKLTSLSDSSSEDGLMKYSSPFGDVTKTQVFSSSDPNKLGVLAFEESVSTTSITIPSVGSALPPTTQHISIVSSKQCQSMYRSHTVKFREYAATVHLE